MVTLESALRRILPVHDLTIGRLSWAEEEEVFGVMVPVEEVEEEVEAEPIVDDIVNVVVGG
jgi:hypothetical protein